MAHDIKLYQLAMITKDQIEFPIDLNLFEKAADEIDSNNSLQ